MSRAEWACISANACSTTLVEIGAMFVKEHNGLFSSNATIE